MATIGIVTVSGLVRYISRLPRQVIVSFGMPHARHIRVSVPDIIANAFNSLRDPPGNDNRIVLFYIRLLTLCNFLFINHDTHCTKVSKYWINMLGAQDRK